MYHVRHEGRLVIHDGQRWECSRTSQCKECTRSGVPPIMCHRVAMLLTWPLTESSQPWSSVSSKRHTPRRKNLGPSQSPIASHSPAHLAWLSQPAPRRPAIHDHDRPQIIRRPWLHRAQASRTRGWPSYGRRSTRAIKVTWTCPR